MSTNDEDYGKMVSALETAMGFHLQPEKVARLAEIEARLELTTKAGTAALVSRAAHKGLLA